MSLFKLKEELDLKIDAKINVLFSLRNQLVIIEKEQDSLRSARWYEVYNELFKINKSLYPFHEYIEKFYPQEVITFIRQINDKMVEFFPCEEND